MIRSCEIYTIHHYRMGYNMIQTNKYNLKLIEIPIHGKILHKKPNFKAKLAFHC